MIEVTIEQMYAEACRRLGEAIVREGVLSAEVQRLAAENAALREQVDQT